MFENIIKLIEKYDRIIIHRHKNPDGDALGSQIGLYHIISDSYPKKQIFMVGDMTPRYAFMAERPMDTLTDEDFSGALSIILDSGAPSLVCDDRYSLAEATARIDHHLFVEKFADVEVIDTSFESCCGEITALAMESGLTLSPLAAKALYTGMVTDSGRFRFRSVSGDTMRLAGLMLDQGIDVDVIYAHLYMKDFNASKFEAYAHKKMKMTENGVVSLYVTKGMKKKFNLSNEEASASVSYMDSIKNSLIWIAFIENGDGSIRVRLRSRFVEVSSLAERYHGGGHACACGATVYSKKEAKALLLEADELLKNYKANNEGWL